MSNRAIYLLHGALGSAETLEPLCKSLRLPQIQALTFSGHSNRSDNKNRFSLAQFANDVLRKMEENDHDTIDIFGYSMGGYVGLYLAYQYPEKVGSVFTLGTKFDWSPETAAKEIKMLDPDKIEEKVPPFAQKLKWRHGNSHWRTVLRNTREFMTALGNGESLRKEHFTQINHQIMIGIGADDNMVSLEESAQVAQWLLGGQLTVFNNMKHPIEQVDTELLAQHIRGFFRRETR